MKQSFYGLSYAELEKLLPNPEVQRQVLRSVYKNHFSSPLIDSSLQLSKATRLSLQSLSFDLPEIIQKQSSHDGTFKLLITLNERQTQAVETVLIPFYKKYTICLSTQVGCAMGCKFCYTATQGLTRNLEVHEIVAQYLIAYRFLKTINPETAPPSIVFMGQGEPLHNFDAVKKAIEILTHPLALGLGPRQITLSTVGHKKGLLRLHELPMINIAFSLHSPFQKERETIIPTAKSQQLTEILELLKQKQRLKKQFITYEYLIIKNFNHSQDHAHEMARLLPKETSLINLIPFNPFPTAPVNFQRPNHEQVEEFKTFLVRYGLRCMIRTTKGDEILAACGQLTSKNRALAVKSL